MITTKFFIYLLVENPNHGILFTKAQLVFEECLKNSDAIACNNAALIYWALVALIAIALLLVV